MNSAETMPAAAAWRRLVDKALAGRPFADLVATAEEGFSIQPLQPPAEPLAIDGRGAQPWARLQRIDQGDADRAAASAIAALNSGASGLALILQSAPGARGFGIAPADLGVVLRGVIIDACPLRVETGADGAAVADRLLAEVTERRIDPLLVDIAFGIDPISAIAASGTGLSDWAERRAATAATVTRLAAAGFRGPFLAADGRRAHEAGADAASELAFVLAAAVAYLRLLSEAGVDPAISAGAAEAVLAADSDQFMTIAKFRAVRLLLRRIHAVSGLPASPLRVHGETSFRMTTRLDPHSNLIRAAIAAFAAGVGGADSITVLPFTAPFGLASDAARRLALDTQSVLVEEANLWRVADPSAGSGSIEQLTLDLAGEAWRRFQAIEADGGLPGALAAGRLQQRIAAERAAREAAIMDGSRVVVGTNLFRAAPPPDIDVEAPFPPAPAQGTTAFEPLASHRASEAAEGVPT